MRNLLAWLMMMILAPAAHAHDAGTGWSYDVFCCNGGRVSGPCCAMKRWWFVDCWGGGQETVLISKPPETSEGDWSRLLAETRPYVLRVFFGQTRQAADLIRQRLAQKDNSSKEYSFGYWADGVYAALELGDGKLAAQALARLARFEPKPPVFDNLKKAIAQPAAAFRAIEP